MEEQDTHELLWQEVVARAGTLFYTEKGAKFTYHVKQDKQGYSQGKLVIDGKRVDITRATVLLAYHRVVELQEQYGFISKPGKIGVYGDKWLYPVFLDIGICTKTKEETARELSGKIMRPDDHKICPNCGYTTEEDFQFCPKCGQKLY